MLVVLSVVVNVAVYHSFVSFSVFDLLTLSAFNLVSSSNEYIGAHPVICHIIWRSVSSLDLN